MDEEMMRDYCRWGRPDRAKKLLSESGEDFDILHEGGIFFQLAIAHKYIELLKVLMDYYTKTKLSGDKDSYAYKAARYKLSVVIKEASEESDITEEMQEILGDFLPPEQTSSESEQDLSGFEDIERELDKLDAEGGRVGVDDPFVEFSSIKGAEAESTPTKVLEEVAAEISKETAPVAAKTLEETLIVEPSGTKDAESTPTKLLEEVAAEMSKETPVVKEETPVAKEETPALELSGTDDVTMATSSITTPLIIDKESEHAEESSQNEIGLVGMDIVD